jgi:hypothetical protein
MPWFRSAPDADIKTEASFGTKTALAINKLLVSFGYAIRKGPDMKIKRIA